MKANSTCINCGYDAHLNYCPNCGQKLHLIENKSLKNQLQLLFLNLFSIDSKWFYTLKTIIKKPGLVSLHMANGITARYLPLRALYLGVVLVFFIFKPFQLLVSDLMVHEKFTPYKSYVSKKIEEKSKEKSLSYEQIHQTFNLKTENVAKWLILIFIPVMVFIFWILNLRKKQFLINHFLLSLEVNVFNIFANFLFLPLILVIYVLLGFLFTGKEPPVSDAFILPTFIILIFSFITIAFKKFYADSWFISGLKASLATFLLLTFMALGYRFLNFYITMMLV